MTPAVEVDQGLQHAWFADPCAAALQLAEPEPAPAPPASTVPPLQSLAEVSQRVLAYRGPTSESNWVIPGCLLVGAFPSSLNDRENTKIIRSILDLGIDTFVCLQSEYKHDVSEGAWRSQTALRPYFKDVEGIARQYRRQARFVHFPIVDCDVVADQDVESLALHLVDLVLAGHVLYVHCWGGHGRTGTVVCLMLHLLYGLDSTAVMERCQFLHDTREMPLNVGSPQTQKQRDQVTRIITSRVQRARLQRTLPAAHAQTQEPPPSAQHTSHPEPEAPALAPAPAPALATEQDVNIANADDTTVAAPEASSPVGLPEQAAYPAPASAPASEIVSSEVESKPLDQTVPGTPKPTPSGTSSLTSTADLSLSGWSCETAAAEVAALGTLASAQVFTSVPAPAPGPPAASTSAPELELMDASAVGKKEEIILPALPTLSAHRADTVDTAHALPQSPRGGPPERGAAAREVPRRSRSGRFISMKWQPTIKWPGSAGALGGDHARGSGSAPGCGAHTFAGSVEQAPSPTQFRQAIVTVDGQHLYPSRPTTTPKSSRGVSPTTKRIQKLYSRSVQ